MTEVEEIDDAAGLALVQRVDPDVDHDLHLRGSLVFSAEIVV